HFRLLVKAWCNLYVSSQGTKRCIVNVVGEEEKPGERCSSTFAFPLLPSF
ncbi:unnamed protein product, partial [Tuber aestivum]